MNQRTLYNLMMVDLETRAVLCEAFREDGLLPGCEPGTGASGDSSLMGAPKLGPARRDAKRSSRAGLFAPAAGEDAGAS